MKTILASFMSAETVCLFFFGFILLTLLMVITNEFVSLRSDTRQIRRTLWR